MTERKASRPALWIALFTVLSMALLHLVQIVRQVDTLFFVYKKFVWGYDYNDFYRAARLLPSASPYQVDRYVTPPTPAILNYPLSRMPFGQAMGIVFLLMVVSIVLLYLLGVGLFFSLKRVEGRQIVLWGLVTLSLSSPVYFLIDRGNIDAFVILPLFLGLFLVGRKDLLAGLCFGLAISLKIYPAVIFLPMLIYRRWRVLVGSLAALALAVLISPRLWWEYLTQQVFQRMGQFRLLENASLANTFAYLGQLLRLLGINLSIDVLGVSASIAYLLLLALVVFVDLRSYRWTRADSKQQLIAALMYIPFMVAFPQLVYQYALLILVPMVPLICYLWKKDPQAERILLVAIVGVALSQIPAVAWEDLTGAPFSHFIPGYGLFLVMMSCVFYKLYNLRQHRPGGEMARRKG